MMGLTIVQGPVVQSIFSLTSSLSVLQLYDQVTLIFFAEE